jgi:hypothetical protein
MNEKELKRFWDKVLPEPNSGCWLWVGSTSSDYGQLRIGAGGRNKGRLVSSHRLAYEHYVGPIPEGLELDHLCRNRFCCNPLHLEAVTHAVNMARSPISISRRRKIATHCSRGHAFDDKNTIWTSTPDGGSRRTCGTCHAVVRKKYRPKYEAANRERLAKRMREYTQQNRDRINAQRAARRALKRAQATSGPPAKATQ